MAAKSLSAIVALAVVLCAGCASGASSSGFPQAVVPGISPAERSLASDYIKHVVVIVQDNRSFENFFAGYPNADAPMWGYGRKHGRRVTIALHRDTFKVEPDLEHLYGTALIDWDNGKMDGFSRWGPNGNDAAYAYIERSQVQPYWDMAKQYVLADHMFPTEFGSSWTAHITLVAGTDNVQQKPLRALVDSQADDSCDAPAGTKTSVITKSARCWARSGLSRASRSSRRWRRTSTTTASRGSTMFTRSTTQASGRRSGFYDNVPPPQLDFRRLGIRVPCLIISPYAKTTYVDKTQYEFGSVLKFTEEVFNLPPIGPGSAWQGCTDTRAASFDDAFDFTQPPRGFKVIRSKYAASY